MSILEPEAGDVTSGSRGKEVNVPVRSQKGMDASRAEDRDILEILTEREQVAAERLEPNFRTVAGGVPSRRASASIAVSSGPSGATIPTRFRSAARTITAARPGSLMAPVDEAIDALHGIDLGLVADREPPSRCSSPARPACPG